MNVTCLGSSDQRKPDPSPAAHRHPTPDRPRLRRFDRWLIGALAGRLQLLMDVVLLVKLETVIGWHHAAWRLVWRWRSHRPPGRPPVDADLRELIRRMWREPSCKPAALSERSTDGCQFWK